MRTGAFAPLRERTALPEQSFLTPASEEPELLGKVLLSPYDRRVPLFAQLSPNPCAEELITVARDHVDHALIEDATRLNLGSTDTSVSEPELPLAYYRLRLSKRVERVASEDYAACCAERQCGVGFVESLTFGEGELATGSETLPNGNADVAFNDQPEPLELALSAPRSIKGFLVATLSHREAIAPMPPSSRYDANADAEYVATRLQLREAPSFTERFEICSATGCITENEFVRLYAEKTGSHELDDFERDRAEEIRISGGLLLGLGALGTIAGGATIGSADEAETEEDRDIMLAEGGAGVGVGITSALIGFGFLIAPRDGTTFDHYLSKDDTRRFLARFNRFLRSGAKAKGAGHARPPVILTRD